MMGKFIDKAGQVWKFFKGRWRKVKPSQPVRIHGEKVMRKHGGA